MCACGQPKPIITSAQLEAEAAARSAALAAEADAAIRNAASAVVNASSR